jgi:hypothetical protein
LVFLFFSVSVLLPSFITLITRSLKLLQNGEMLLNVNN